MCIRDSTITKTNVVDNGQNIEVNENSRGGGGDDKGGDEHGDDKGGDEGGDESSEDGGESGGEPAGGSMSQDRDIVNNIDFGGDDDESEPDQTAGLV